MIIVHALQALGATALRRLRPAAGALGCALLLGAPAVAAGQRLTGSVADATSREPIPLALIALVDSAGTVLQQVLTNEAGRFIMVPRAAGRVRLRIERIGYAAAHEPFFDLTSDTERDFRILIAVQPITLEGIAVTDERICSINASASETLRVWTEARKALAAALLAEQQRLVRFSGVRFRREVTEDGTVTMQRTRPFLDSYRQPFRSLAAADLIESGYVRTGDGINFFAPNAEVLLSPEFERSNCFSLTRNAAEPGLIGVRFTPNLRQVVPSIAGVAWLDTRGASLRFVEFEYVNTPRIPYAHLASGRVEFQMLPNGGWLVSRWWIRMPSTVQGTGRSARAVRFVEDGGEVRTAGAGAASWSILGTGAIVGAAVDSTSGRPLRDATITVEGTALSARTDANGAFHIGNVPVGKHVLTLSHARLDSLPAYPDEVKTVQVEANDSARVALAIPPLTRSALASCVHTVRAAADRVAVYGVIRAQDTGDVLPHIRLRLSWDSVFRAADQLAGVAKTMDVETDEQGRYIACDLPGGMTIRVELHDEGRLIVRTQFHTVSATARVDGRSIMYWRFEVPRSDLPHAVPRGRASTPRGSVRP